MHIERIVLIFLQHMLWPEINLFMLEGFNQQISPFSNFTVPITTKVLSSNPVHGEVYSIQYYVIKFVNEFRQAGGFLHQ
jgi:hypothetical protein